MLVRMWCYRNSYTAGGTAKWYSHFGRQLAVSYKTKHTLIIWSSSCAPWHLPKCPYKNLHIGIYSVIHNCPNLEATKMSFKRWMDSVVCPHNGLYYSALKRNESSNHSKTWRKLTSISVSERSQFEKATYCMIPVTNVLLWGGGMFKQK